MADVAVLEKENLTPSGRSTTAAKRPADWKAEKGEQPKKKGGLRPSTRVTNVPNVARDSSQPSKPAVMGPPPPRVPHRADDGPTAGPSKAPVQVKMQKDVNFQSRLQVAINMFAFSSIAFCQYILLGIFLMNRPCCSRRLRVLPLKPEQALMGQPVLSIGTGGGSLQILTLAGPLDKGSLAACT